MCIRCWGATFLCIPCKSSADSGGVGGSDDEGGIGAAIVADLVSFCGEDVYGVGASPAAVGGKRITIPIPLPVAPVKPIAPLDPVVLVDPISHVDPVNTVKVVALLEPVVLVHPI